MANRQWYDVQALDTFEIVQGGSFLPQGSSAPHIPTVTGTGQLVPVLNGAGSWSVTRLSTGRFQLLLNKPLSLLKCVRVSLQQSAASQLRMTVGPINYANRTIELDCISTATGALTDISANASNAVHWSINQSIDNSQNQASTPG